MNNLIEWFLKGPCVWSASILGVAVNLAMIFIHLYSYKCCKKSTLYIVLIAASGICMILMEQSIWLQVLSVFRGKVTDTGGPAQN